MSIIKQKSHPVFCCSLFAILLLAGCFESRGHNGTSDPGTKEPVSVNTEPRALELRYLMFTACRELLFNIVKHADRRRRP
jgi:hypothetical protein